MRASFYFPHDYHARSDRKMVALIRKHGWEGYGIYWAVIEKLYEEGGQLPTNHEELAYDFRVNTKLVSDVTGFEGLFYMVAGGKAFRSKSVDRRIAAREDKVAQARAAAGKRWQSGRNADAELPLSHRGDRGDRGDKGKEIEGGATAPGSRTRKGKPTLDEVKGYCEERRKAGKTPVDAEQWFDFYSSKGFLIGKNPMKDWKAAVRTWERNRNGSGAPGRVVGAAQPTRGKYDHLG